MQGSRRKFLGLSLGILTAAAAGAVTYPVIKYLAPGKKADARHKVEIPEGEVPEGSAKFFEFEGRIAVLVRKKGGALIALSAVCTHLGCIVQWQKEKEQFLCPCHAGIFSADGAVLSGPPPKPLEKLVFTVASGRITVG